MSGSGTTIDQIIAEQHRHRTRSSLRSSSRIEDVTGYVGACDTGLQLRLPEHDVVADPHDAGADGNQPARRVRAALRTAGHRRASAWRAAAWTPAFSIRCVRTPRDLNVDWARAIAPGSRIPRQRAGHRAADTDGGEERGERPRPSGHAGRHSRPLRGSCRVCMFELMALAYEADLTRVATFMMAREAQPADLSGNQLHGAAPSRLAPPWGGSEPVEARDAPDATMSSSSRDSCRSCATPDGDGSLLDHTMLLYGSGMSNSDIHSPIGLPLVVLGGGAAA